MPTLAPETAIAPGVAAEEARIRRAYVERVGHGRYSWFDCAHLYAMQEVERVILRALRTHGFAALADLRILDIGCGYGVWLREFVKWGATPGNLVGIDLLEDRIAQARRLAPPAMRLEIGSAAALPFEDAAFDIAVQSLVLTSVTDPDVRARIAAEMIRVVRPGGLILSYDYHVDNPANRDVRALTAADLRRLFGGCDIARRRVTLAPPVARFVAPRSRALYALLAAIPLMKTHYVAAIRKPHTASI